MSESKIEDFIPYYDPDGNYNQYKEIADMKLSKHELFVKGELRKHQEVIARIMSPYSPIRDMLIYHGTGQGKTCLSIAVAEAYKANKKILLLVPNDHIARNHFREIAEVCTRDVYIAKRTKEEIKKNLQISEKIKDGRIKAEIQKFYEISTYETFINEWKNKDGSGIKEEAVKQFFSNHVIIVDEAHHLRIQADKTKRSLYDNMLLFLRTVRKQKQSVVLLLTATPMWDQSNEIASIMNLILDEDEALPTEGKFDKLFKDDELTKEGKKILYNAFTNRVSYMRSAQSDTKVSEISSGKKVGKYNNFVAVELTEKQKELMKKHPINKDSEADDSKEESSFLRTQREIGNGVFPNGDYGTDAFTKNSDLKGITADNIGKFFPKFDSAIKTIISRPKEKFFAFSDFVQGSGVLLFSQLLKLQGYSQITDTSINYNTKKPRFVVISSNKDTVSESLHIRQILRQYNDPKNMYGEYIAGVVGSGKLSEGITLKDTRQVHILQPHWNLSQIEQALGRSIRFQSHDNMPEAERYVNVYRYASAYPEDSKLESADEHIINISEDKSIKIAKIRRLIKKSSIDCVLTYDHNVYPTDVDYSQGCDYEKCAYSCKNDIVAEHDQIDTNYNLLYSRGEVLKVAHMIHEIFNHIFFISFQQLFSNLSKRMPKLSKHILCKTIEHMINTKVEIRNKYGFVNYLKEDNDIIFIHPSPLAKINYNTAIYSILPVLNMETSIEQCIRDSAMTEDYIRFDYKECDFEKFSISTKILILEDMFMKKKQFSGKLQKYNKYFCKMKGDVVVHELYNEEFKGIGYNISSRQYPVNGKMRIYDPKIGRFRFPYFPQEEQNYIDSYEIKREKIDAEIYGLISEKDKKFRIVMKGNKGIECTNMKLPDLLDLCMNLKIYPDIEEEKTRESLLATIKGLYVTKDTIFKKSKYDYSKFDDKKLARFAKLLDMTKEEYCEMIYSYFEENNLILQE